MTQLKKIQNDNINKLSVCLNNFVQLNEANLKFKHVFESKLFKYIQL